MTPAVTDGDALRPGRGADDDGRLADPEAASRAEDGGLHDRALDDGQDGQIALRVGAGRSGPVGPSVGAGELDGGGAVDEVEVRQYVAVGAEHHARAEPVAGRSGGPQAHDGRSHRRRQPVDPVGGGQVVDGKVRATRSTTREPSGRSRPPASIRIPSERAAPIRPDRTGTVQSPGAASEGSPPPATGRLPARARGSGGSSDPSSDGWSQIRSDHQGSGTVRVHPRRPAPYEECTDGLLRVLSSPPGWSRQLFGPS